MIKTLKQIIEWKLRIMATWVLKRYQPKIIGITGSVGKTSAKEAIHTVLSSKFKVWKNIKNYNNELGVPLSILGMESGFKNPMAWLGVFIKGLSLVLFKSKKYPEYLVLEMGADKPGDIKYLVSFAKCNVGIITAIGSVHTEFFGSLEKVIREKQQIISHLKVNDFAILNIDDDLVQQTKEKTRAKIINFGFSDEADIRAMDVNVSAGQVDDPWANAQVKGLSFKLIYKGAAVPVFLPSVLGEHQVYSALIAAAVGFTFGLNAVEITEALKNFKSPPGRMKLIPGIKHTSIIDDSYNSSPMAAKAALRVLHHVKISGRKFAALGDMLELGAYTDQGHQEIGIMASKVVDYLITVGERSKMTAKAAISNGMSEDRVFTFGNPEAAGKFIQQRIQKGDILLAKGSQGSRMEKIVKELMAEPLKAKDLLVRQGPEWLD